MADLLHKVSSNSISLINSPRCMTLFLTTMPFLVRYINLSKTSKQSYRHFFNVVPSWKLLIYFHVFSDEKILHSRLLL